VDFIAFLEEELRKIRTILARDACDERFLHLRLSFSRVN
jgi:hypothetical protein